MQFGPLTWHMDWKNIRIRIQNTVTEYPLDLTLHPSPALLLQKASGHNQACKRSVAGASFVAPLKEGYCCTLQLAERTPQPGGCWFWSLTTSACLQLKQNKYVRVYRVVWLYVWCMSVCNYVLYCMIVWLYMMWCMYDDVTRLTWWKACFGQSVGFEIFWGANMDHLV